MARRWLIGLLVLGASGAGLTRLYVPHPPPHAPTTYLSKQVVGQTAWVEIPESGLGFLGRVDTGAKSTSVHAESIREDGTKVDFVLVNRSGGRVKMRAPIAKTSMVRNGVGRELRIYVDLTIRHEGMEKRLRASLNNRSELDYALLLGRDWLQDDFVVDVAREPEPPPDSWETVQTVAEGSRGMASR